MGMLTIKVENPESMNVVMGQVSFVENIGDIFNALRQTAPDLHFGLAFTHHTAAESGDHAGTDEALIDLARRNADRVGTNQTFFLFTETDAAKEVLLVLKQVPAIQAIYCATSSADVEVIVHEAQGVRGVMGLAGTYTMA